MDKELNKKKLIKDAQDLIFDNHLPFAEKIEETVQKILINGHSYIIKVSIERLYLEN